MLSGSFKSGQGRLEFCSDIAKSDGQILLDGPSSEIGLGTSADQQAFWAAMCLGDFVRFASDHLGEVREALL